MRVPKPVGRFYLVVAVVAGLAIAPAMVASAPSATAATSEATSTSVTAPIQALDEALIEVMRAGRKTSFQQRYALLAPAVEQALDLPFILRISVGLGWSSMSSQQQQELLDAFRKYTIASYLDNFDSYDGQKLVIEPNPRQLATGEQVITTEVIPVSGSPHKLAYVMHKLPDGTWKAIDVLADGTISRVAVQRSDWSSLLTQGGAPALLATLQKKTEALSQG